MIPKNALGGIDLIIKFLGVMSIFGLWKIVEIILWLINNVEIGIK